MSSRIYETDPYCSWFEANVVEVRREWVILDRTAFYPGGGGQDPDRGTISGMPVSEVRTERDEVLHRVPGNNLVKGQRVNGHVDWERRYDLMRGHTAEHLLFSCLSKLNPDIELVKIAITPDKKGVIVRGQVDWQMVSKAQEMALQAIIDGLETKDYRVRKDDPCLRDARVKLDRIHGDLVRVVQIGEIDRAACSGVHIRNTGELDLILVSKFTSAKPTGDWEVEFEVGQKAKLKALELSGYALHAAEMMGSRPQDLLSAVSNLKGERNKLEAALKKYGAQALANLIPSQVGGVKLYSGSFEGMDKKTLMDAATDFIKEEAACVLSSVDDKLMLIVACHPALKVDCVAVLNEALAVVGGKGGGKPNFATGGASSTEKVDDVMVTAIISLRKALEELTEKSQ